MSASNLSFDSAVASLQPKVISLLPFTNHYLRARFTPLTTEPSNARPRSSSFLPADVDCSPQKPPRSLATRAQRRIEVNTPDLRFLIGMEGASEDSQSELKTDRPETPVGPSTTIKSEPPSASLPMASMKRTPLPIHNMRLLVACKPRMTAAPPIPDPQRSAKPTSRGAHRYNKSLTSHRSILVQGARCTTSQKAYILESEVREVMNRAIEREQNAALLHAKLRAYFQSGASRKLRPMGLKRNRAAVSSTGFYPGS